MNSTTKHKEPTKQHAVVYKKRTVPLDILGVVLKAVFMVILLATSVVVFYLSMVWLGYC